MHPSLGLFSEYTSHWFDSTLGAPTAVQQEAWPAIASGKHTLVSAPTGTGKTLSAFLVFIDRLKAEARVKTLKNELRVLYISPLKALAGDIRENLHRPLDGIYNMEHDRGEGGLFNVNVAVRTGDTTASDRRRMIKTPPHILITTPESLFLLLTSDSGRKMLSTARTVILDELHAMMGSKRGTHLMLSLARLDTLCNKPLQRIGLSATIEPLSEAARYLAPEGEEVIITAPKMEKRIEIRVTSPMTDTRALPSGSVWSDIAASVYDKCADVRSVIAFVDGRMYAEKLCYHVNAIAGSGFARTHHGCVSKEQRHEAENALRSGELRLLVATSSMELGIDVGDIDRVLQIGCPRSISSVLQRLGRAGHNPGRVSVMNMFPRTADEGLYCGMTAKTATEGLIETLSYPKGCLDVLAQHIVSMAASGSLTVDEILETIKRAAPFEMVTREDVESVLRMLAGDYEHDRDVPARPRILYDRISGTVEGDAYSRMLALSAGGTIPDTGMFAVKNESGVKLGELDEEFVFEARKGDKFLLGSFSWKILNMTKDTVTVTQASREGARPPFWRNAWLSRGFQTGIFFGKLFRELNNAAETGGVFDFLLGLGMDEMASRSAESFLQRQINSTGALPNDKLIIVEHFRDETGAHQLMVHSIFGKRINAGLSLLAHEAAVRVTNSDYGAYDDDDGFLLFPYGAYDLPEGLLQTIKPEESEQILRAMLPATALFGMVFRYNAARALMMGVRKAARLPLWVQRLRGAEMLDGIIRIKDHPLIRETMRECLEDYWDLPGIRAVLDGIRSGNIAVRELHLSEPSPMSLPLRRQAEANMLYEYSPTTGGIISAGDENLRELRGEMITPSKERLKGISERTRLPRDEKELHSALMAEGDLIASELSVPVEWLMSLERQGRARYIDPGLWIAAEHSEHYEKALDTEDGEARQMTIRRALRYRGPFDISGLAQRYSWSAEESKAVLSSLAENGSAVLEDGLYYHAELYERARNKTIQDRRRQIVTLPAENYADLMARRVGITAPPDEQLRSALMSLRDTPLSPALWENAVLPARVTNYRPALLDGLLTQGEFFWKMNGDSLSFHLYEDIDWDSEITLPELTDDEKTVYETLKKRGASFFQGLRGLIGGDSPRDILLSLAAKGLVRSDSYLPVRQLIERDKEKKLTTRQSVNSRVMTMSSGRWEIAKPVMELPTEKKLEKALEKAAVLTRETLPPGLSWQEALDLLRIWEFTGKVRRGYFIEGLSGAQFITESSFEEITLALAAPRDEIAWLCAADPALVWGKALTHREERQFISIAGTYAAIRGGEVVAVLERQGQSLRVFNGEHMKEALAALKRDYSLRKVLPAQSRLVIKSYPADAADALASAGFLRQMNDFVLLQGYR